MVFQPLGLGDNARNVIYLEVEGICKESAMSSSEEIADVYNRDIYQKTKQVFLKSGYRHFLDGFAGMTVTNMFTKYELEGLRKITEADTREGLMIYSNAPKRIKVGGLPSSGRKG